MNRKISAGILIVLFCACLPLVMEAGPISFRLYGGAAYLGGGDLNGGLQGWADYWIGYYNYTRHQLKTGAFNPVHLGYNFGGDVVFQLTPRLGIGLGTEYLMAKRTTTLTFQPDWTWDYFGNPQAVPVKLSVFYSLPSGNRFKTVFHAGVGYYWAKADMESHFKGADFIDYVIDSSASGVGFHGGVGLEWELSSHLSLLVEGAGRYVSLSGFEGTTSVTDSNGSGSWKGKLYYFGSSRSYVGDYNYIDQTIGAPSGAGVRFCREAKVDFSGCSLRMGAVIRL